MSTATDCLGRFVWHELWTSDVPRAMEFYGALFPEWTIGDAVPEVPMPYHLIFAGEVGVGGIYAAESSTESPARWIGYVAVEDCDAAVRKLEQHGGECVIPAQDMPDVGRFAGVRDAQGAMLEVFQAASEVKLPERPADGQFCWDELLTTDVEAAKKAFADAFGWTTRDMPMGPEGTYTMFRSNDMDAAGAMAKPADMPAPSAWLSYLMVGDVDERSQRAVDLGAATCVAPQDIPGVGRFAVHVDPTGAAFAIFKPLPRVEGCEV